MSDLVSIIMPSYNTAKFIGDSIESVLNQTYTNWELIIVDDCSTDDTDKIVNNFKDSRIKYLKNKKNLGAALTRNKALREAGVHYKVFKNTLIKRAAEGTDFAQLDPVLDGPTALAVSKDDATAAARIFAKFAKTSPKLEFKGAVVEGKFYDAKAVQALAEIPSREELLGRLLGSIKSPISNFARVLNQIAQKGDGEAA